MITETGFAEVGRGTRSDLDDLAKDFWEFVDRRIEGTPNYFIYPRLAQDEQKAVAEGAVVASDLIEKLGGGKEAWLLVDKLVSAKTHECAIKKDAIYIKGLQDGIMLAEKLKSGIFPWLASVWPLAPQGEEHAASV